jgi:hypothetical protein
VKWYVYEIVVSGKVVYIGKGHGDRMYYHRYILNHPNNGINNRPMYVELRRLVNLAGGDFVERIVFQTDNELAALIHESKLIHEHGIENLTNIATHAFVGRKIKESSRKLMGVQISRAKRSWTLDHKARVNSRISAAKRGTPLTESHRAALRVPKTKTEAYWKGRERASKTLRLRNLLAVDVRKSLWFTTCS